MSSIQYRTSDSKPQQMKRVVSDDEEPFAAPNKHRRLIKKGKFEKNTVLDIMPSDDEKTHKFANKKGNNEDIQIKEGMEVS
ncbi:hypothetical protein Tco_1283925 [Tanacetum coccineum]